jgi:hypothetical protein
MTASLSRNLFQVLILSRVSRQGEKIHIIAAVIIAQLRL